MPVADARVAAGPKLVAAPTTTICRICGGRLGDSVLVCRDEVVTDELFNLLSCKDCGSLTTDPSPDPDSIGHYYPPNYSSWGTDSGCSQKVYNLARSFTTLLRVRQAQRSSSRSTGAILDIGCGDGTFLHAMQRRGWLACGVEPTSTARHLASLPSLPVYESAERINPPAGGFDIVTFWHSLEHVHDLDSALVSTLRVLGARGRVLIAVPNFRSADADHYGARWAAYDVPRHLYHFSVDGIARLAGRHRLRLRSVTPCRRDVFYVASLSERGTMLRRAVRALGFALICVARTVVRPLAASSLVYTLDRDVA